MTANWHYSNNGSQAGPVSEAELQQLVTAGELQEQSLVWREGLPDWQPAAVALPSAFGSRADVPQLGGISISDLHKDALVQQMREGVFEHIPGEMQFAGFWIRCGARFVDGLILQIPYLLVKPAVTAMLSAPQLSFKPGEFDAKALAPVLLQMTINIFIAAIYEIGMLSKYGATLGKKALKLKVVTADGGPLTFGRSVGRYLSTWVSSMALGVGYLMAGFDAQKRTLHDRIASTLVIKSR